MISIENKLFEEADRPEDSKIISADNDNGIIERERAVGQAKLQV